MKRPFALIILVLLCLAACSKSPNQLYTPLSEQAELSHQAMLTKGADWLASQQRPTGSWGQYQSDIGIAALALAALNRVDPQKYAPQIDKCLKLILSKQIKEGKNKGAFADVDGKYLNYRTCVALRALYEIDAEKYQNEIKMAQHFIKGLQFLDENQTRDYGAIGYGSKIRGDLSNTQFALEALAETGVSPSDPVFKRAKIFLERLQNFQPGGSAEANDGGFPYGIREGGAGKSPRLNTEEEKYASYGSMTYSGLKSMIYARMTPADPRVQAAFRWIRDHYTLDRNPGLASIAEPAKAQQGLYYYYHTFAKTLNLMSRYGTALPYGEFANWKLDLIEAIGQRQKPDGYWVNETSRWFEADAHLVTAYCLLALTEIS